eukprot:TRINITY_DN612_c0_g1_i4.p1 TRINITY_DN612_c0_g1~~TRINITY_DN612_c0_g1_i4.p1  ORF type:complete len:771 (+),score=313.46 TRINITY_DN612_c0_g1_i4:176-2488(+)
MRSSALAVLGLVWLLSFSVVGVLGAAGECAHENIWDLLEHTPISTKDIRLVVAMLGLLLLVSFLWELFFETLEEIFKKKHRHIIAIIHKLFQELAMLGVWSVSLLLIQEVAELPTDLLHLLELTHIALFFLVIFYIAFVVVMAGLNILVFLTWKYIERRDKTYISAQYETMKRNIKKLPFFISWIYFFSIRFRFLRLLCLYNAFRSHFIEQNGLSNKFHFYRYLKRSAKDLFCEWAIVHWSVVGIVFLIQFLIWVAVTNWAPSQRGVAYVVITAVGFLWFSLFYYHVSDVFETLSHHTSLMVKPEDHEDPEAPKNVTGSKKSDSDNPIYAPAGVFDPMHESSDEISDQDDHQPHEARSGRRNERNKKRSRPVHRSGDKATRGRNRQKNSSSDKSSSGGLSKSSSGVKIPLGDFTSLTPEHGSDGSDHEKDHPRQLTKLQSIVDFVRPSILAASSRGDFYENISDLSDVGSSSDSSIESDSWDESWTSESSWYSSSDGEEADPFHSSPSGSGGAPLGSSAGYAPVSGVLQHEFEDDNETSFRPKQHHHKKHHHHQHHHRVHHHHKPRKLLPSDLEIFLHGIIPFLLCRITIPQIIKNWINTSGHRKLFWLRSPAVTLYISQLLLFYQATLVTIGICGAAGIITMDWFDIVASAILLIINTFFYLPNTVYKFSLSLSVGEFTDKAYIEEVNLTAHKKAKKHLLTRTQMKSIRDSIWDRAQSFSTDLPAHPREILRRNSKSHTDNKDSDTSSVPISSLPTAPSPPAIDPLDIV